MSLRWHWYSDVIFRFPFTVFCLSLWLFFVMPLAMLALYPMRLDSNPEKGFNTRNTVYSSPRIGWSQLQPSVLQGSRVVVDGKREKRSWADDLLASLGSVACYDQPIAAMDYLSQVILEVKDFESLFSKPFINEACQMSDQLRPALTPFDAITPHRTTWHVANYFACLAPESRMNCSYIKSDDISKVKKLVEFCSEYRAEIIECRQECLERMKKNQMEQHPLAEVKCSECRPDMVPANCSSQMMFDLFFRVLPKDLSSKPLNVNVFLPVYTYTSYQLQGFQTKLTDFLNIQGTLQHLKARTYEIKGALLEIKRDLLLHAAIDDSKYSLLAGALVISLVIIYTKSITYCVACIIQLIASVASAAAVHRIFSVEFPLLNMIVFVLLISIGSDGAFLLYSSFPPTKDQLNKERFRDAVYHTSSTMFLTQFSTVVPFFLNMFSAVLAFRSFGLFAGFTLIFNYLMLVSFLPAVLILQRRHIDPIAKKCLRPLNFLFYYLNDKIEEHSNYLLSRLLPAVIIKCRYLWLISLLSFTSINLYLSVTGLHLPQYNPLQLFIASDLNEYYDNHAEKLFEFVEHKIALPLTIRLVWGIEANDYSPHFDTHEISNLNLDPHFKLDTVEKLKELASYLLRLRTLFFVQHPSKYWPERFLDWSARLPCDKNDVCCNVNNAHYVDSYLDHCMRVSTSQLITNYNDTPLYHNITYEFVGYTALLPTRLKYSHRFGNLSKAFELLDENLNKKGMWYTPEWGLMSTWFDLQRSIIGDSKQSIIISLVVVLLFASSILKTHALCALFSIICIVICISGSLVMMGWEVGMLESIIMVLAVSLSFDYTLHYGAAVPSNKNACPKHRIQTAIRRSTQPVSMAALSSSAAGLAMMASKTHAFYQVAVFLLVSTAFSFLFATFFFLPLLYLFLRPSSTNQCDSCTYDSDTQMKEGYIHRIRQ